MRLHRLRVVVASLVGLTGLAWCGSALMAQGGLARAEPSDGSTPRFAPGFGGGFGGGQAEKRPEPAVATVYVTPPVSEAAAKTWIKLQKVVDIGFANESPLEEVLKYFKDVTKGKDDKGLRFYIDPVGLQEAEKTMSSPVLLEMEGIAVSTGLTLMLKQLGLIFWVHQDGFVVITDESKKLAIIDPSVRILEEVSALRLEVESLRTQLRAR